MPPRTDKGKGQQRPRITVCEAPQSAVCPPPQSQVEPMSTTSQHFMPLQSSMGYPPPQTQVDPMTMGSQPFLSLLSSHGYPMAQLGNPSFISPSGNPSFISPSGNPSFISPSGTSSYHQTGGSSFPHPSQVPPPFMQSGIFPDPTQVPLSSQHPTNTPSSSTLSRSHTPPTTHMPSSSTHHGGSRTPHPPRATDIPVPEEQEEQDDQEQQDDHVLEQPTANPTEYEMIDGRYFIEPCGKSFSPSRPAAQCVKHVIQQMYKKAWKSFKELSKDEKDEWFDKFKEKCTWNVMDEYMIRKNYRGRTSVRLSDMLRRVRLDWEERNIRPNWIGKEVFDELLAYWATDNFKAKSQKAKDMRASERGGCLNATGSISIGEHAKRMTKAQGRPPRLNELFVKTRTKKSGDLVDDRSRRTIEEYQRLLTQFLVENPQYTPVGSNPLDPRVDMYIWSLVTGGKGRNGCFFGVGPLAGNYRTGDRTLFDRVASGEGTSRPTQLTPEMMETVRQLALTEARRETAEREAALKAELEEMKKRQHDMEEQMRQFMQSMSRNQNQRTTEDDEDDDEFDV
ncbi:unnamed protein product [Lathyrus oleraceus]